MIKLLAVASGGAIGSIGRYLLSIIAEKIAGLNFPAGTFAVNIIGSLLIGFCWNYFDKIHISNEFRLFVFTGFLGGFTTFSTFTRESAQLIKAGESGYAVSYMLVSNIVGLSAVFLGFYLSHRILR